MAQARYDLDKIHNSMNLAINSYLELKLKDDQMTSKGKEERTEFKRKSGGERTEEKSKKRTSVEGEKGQHKNGNIIIPKYQPLPGACWAEKVRGKYNIGGQVHGNITPHHRETKR